MYYAPESDFRVTIYDHLNFSRALVVQFQPSRYIMRLNRTSIWKVMTIWISREHSLFNFERLDVLCALIGLPCHKLWPLEFLESIRGSISTFSIYYTPESYFHVTSYDHWNLLRAFGFQFRTSRYIILLNRTSVWSVMTIWVSWELPLFNFKLLDILCAWIGLPFEKLWPFEFHESIRSSISSVSMYYAPESDFCDKLRPFEFLENIRCWISSVSIYCAPQSDLRVISYDHLSFWRASVVQFQASQYIMCLNRTSIWKVMTIWISQEHSLFNFEGVDVLRAWTGLPCDKLWPYEFLESFRCSISSV